ncbi:MAG: hypothetical protein ABI577_08180 [bacterium]
MHRWKLPALILVLLAFATISEAPHSAHAATTRTWTGAVNLNWNTAGNWNPSGVPVDGDSVFIGAPAFGKTLNNDRPASLVLASVAFGTSTTIVGNGFGVSNSLQQGAGNADVTLDIPITLKADIEVIVATNSRMFMRQRLSPMGTVGLDMGSHSLVKNGAGDIEFDSDLVGTGGFGVQTGEVSFIYPVTFGGTIVLLPGTRALLTVLGNGTGFCGSAPNASFALSSAILSAACVVSIKSVKGTGEIEMFSDQSRLFIAGAGGGAVFDGKFTGAAPSTIICCSNGGQTLRGTSTFTGGIFVNSGALYFGGARFPAASTITVQGDGQFRASLVGYGTFGDTIITGGDLALSAINDQFGFARFPGLQFAPNDLLDFEFQGGTAGTGYTQIVMTGQIVLDSVYLRLDFGGYVPPVGQNLTLIKGATALLDTMKNFYDGQNAPLLAEGATFTVPGPLGDSGNSSLKFKITYKGGAGHDVIITRLASGPPPVTTYKRILPLLARD